MNRKISNFRKIFSFIKNNFIEIFFLLFIILLILFSNTNLSAAKNGLNLWANSVVPALLPFFIATELLSYTNIAQNMSKILDPIMQPLFNVPRMRCLCLLIRSY